MANTVSITAILSKPNSTSFLSGGMSLRPAVASRFRMARNSAATSIKSPCASRFGKIVQSRSYDVESRRLSIFSRDQHGIQPAEGEREGDRGPASHRLWRQHQRKIAFRVGAEIVENRGRHAVPQCKNRRQKFHSAGRAEHMPVCRLGGNDKVPLKSVRISSSQRGGLSLVVQSRAGTMGTDQDWV